MVATIRVDAIVAVTYFMTNSSIVFDRGPEFGPTIVKSWGRIFR
jgi:hypothetical protein